ncbi:MAG: hypothetical protein AAF740_03685 [Bacteroidota bacterium]
MPANPKYLSSSRERFLKVSAAILGGYLVAMGLHMVWGMLLSEETQGIVVATTTFSGFTLWVLLMIPAFLVKKGAHIWAIYGGITLVCAAVIYLLKTFPI